MSQVMNAIIDGTAKEFKARVNGVARFVVIYNGKYYTNNMGRFIPVAKSKVTAFFDAPAAMQ